MPSAPDRSPSSGRSIFSRIASPFSSKSRNIAEFTVQPDDEHRQYSPGDIVTGCVKLRVSRPTRVTHIVVCLHGFVQVYKNPGSPGDGFRANRDYLGTGRGTKSGEYFGNGFASLFEDEVVLCGDGRLAEGSYQFNFELEFPDRDLPSSIDFERGTITYMITASMTRPTTISPIMTNDRKIYFVERIDISPLYPPKPRTITLEPLSKRSRAKTQARKLVDSSEKSRKTEPGQQGSNILGHSEPSSAPSTRTDNQTPVSPVPSEISFDSRISSHERTSQPDSQQRESSSASDTGRVNCSKSSLANKVINATIESQAGGCLRGDTIPVKVNISHTKHVKSLYGVIVTLYRQARVDMRPALPLGPVEKGKDAKFEDYYPKSSTGLGGLSLSGAGSTHVFRKDLSQVMVPLMIDPQTLTTEVFAKVRVPEEVFPTISTVPGQMISFKYYIEVIVDIQGKLSGQYRSLNNLAKNGAPNGHYLNVDGSDMERSAFTPFGSTIVDTMPVRRDKSVVTCAFEVIIGTRDSDRKKGKQKVQVVTEQGAEEAALQDTTESMRTANVHAPIDWYDASNYTDQRWYEEQYAYDYASSEQYHWAQLGQHYEEPLPPVPIPQIPDESQMSEKDRVRLAEARLLPSAPPGIDDENGQASAGATAPYLPEESVNGYTPQNWPTALQYESSASSSRAFSSGISPDTGRTSRMPSVPEYAPPEPGSSAQAAVAVGDDKQEIQRRQLAAEASAPPDDEEDDDEPSLAVPNREPSAPTLDEAESQIQDPVHDSHADAAGFSELPRYER